MLTEHDAAIRRLIASYERDPSRRQDLVQDIWLAVWQALPRFRDECSERTFVFRIAHNRAVSHIEHWQRRHTDPLDDQAPIADSYLVMEHGSPKETRVYPEGGHMGATPGLNPDVIATVIIDWLKLRLGQ